MSDNDDSVQAALDEYHDAVALTVQGIRGYPHLDHENHLMKKLIDRTILWSHGKYDKKRVLAKLEGIRKKSSKHNDAIADFLDGLTDTLRGIGGDWKKVENEDCHISWVLKTGVHVISVEVSSLVAGIRLMVRLVGPPPKEIGAKSKKKSLIMWMGHMLLDSPRAIKYAPTFLNNELEKAESLIFDPSYAYSLISRMDNRAYRKRFGLQDGKYGKDPVDVHKASRGWKIKHYA